MKSIRNVVPPADSTNNETIRDVIGNKDDAVTSDSIFAHVHSIEEHMHSASKVYPTLAGGVAVAGAAGAWTLGDFVEIVPVNTITELFDIHWISIENLDDNTVYELVLYAVEVEIGRVRFTKNANLDAVMNHPIQCEIQAANTQIQAKLASAAGSSVATISLLYHEYP